MRPFGLLLVGLAGCHGAGGSGVCLSQFPASEGYGFTSDGSGTATGSSGPTVGDLLAECAADGSTDCDVAVTREAALCIADGEGIGTNGRTAGLVYHVQYRAIIWNVQAVDHGTGATSEGSGISIHAGTGEVLGTYGWSAMP